MAKFRCPYGHVEAKDGILVPMQHESRARCSIYVKLRGERKVDLFGRPIAGVDISSYMIGRTPPRPADAPAPSAGAPSPEPTLEGGTAPTQVATSGKDRPQLEKREGMLRRLGTGLGVRYHEVGTTPPGAGGAPVGESDWLISEETSERFWTVIFSFIETAINLITQFFEIPPVPREVFEVDPGQSFVFRTALRPTTTNILKKVFGARSPEEADRIVAGLSGLLGFGMMSIKIVIHFMLNLPKSPKLANWRKAREEKRAKLQAERDAARADGSRPAPAALPAPRPA